MSHKRVARLEMKTVTLTQKLFCSQPEDGPGAKCECRSLVNKTRRRTSFSFYVQNLQYLPDGQQASCLLKPLLTSHRKS